MTWKRVLTAAVLIPVVVSAVWWGPTWLVAVLVGLVLLLALVEFFAMAQQTEMPGFRIWTMFCSVLILVVQWGSVEESFLMTNSFIGRSSWVTHREATDLPFYFVVFVLIGGAVAVLSRRGVQKTLSAVGTSAVGLLFIALPMSYIVRIHGMGEGGPRLLLFTLLVVWAGDTAAYFVGRAIGRRKLAPAISPGKTWEGAVANVAASLAVGYLFVRWVPIGLAHMLVMAGLASVAGQVGDLFESAVKRGAGVKDSGTLLPGHGGMWDRIDALIFAAPTVWWYLAIMGS